MTSQFHTMVHVLKQHKIVVPPEKMPCSGDCNQGRHVLVPRVRPTSIWKWWQTVYGRYPCQRSSEIPDILLSIPRVRKIMFNSCSNFYLKENRNNQYYCLMIGLDVSTKHHLGFGCLNSADSIVIVERKEEEARGFLVGLRPLLRKLWTTINTNKFLKAFTSLYPVKWDEVHEVIFHDLSLTTLSLERVRQLPLKYLEKHCSPRLWHFLKLSQFIRRPCDKHAMISDPH